MERKNPFQFRELGPLPAPGNRPLEVQLIRGNTVESRHRVHAAVVKAGQGVVRSWGSPELALFPRSSIKLMQALSWVAPGFYKKWDLGYAEMAIACGSHEGEPKHVETVAAWLHKLGLGVQDLECGGHDPYSRSSTHALYRDGKQPSALHNNCSGKHTGFLTCCLAMGWPTKGYINYDHPVQEKVREILGQFWERDVNQLPWGVDGCGIPTYSVTLAMLAHSMALAADPRKLDGELREGVGLLNRAITAKSEYIGGSESFCSQVVAETEGRVFAKVGAEGVYGVWIPAAQLGLAFKCEDGAARAAETAVASVLAELGYPLRFYRPLVRRWSGEAVGQFLCT